MKRRRPSTKDVGFAKPPKNQDWRVGHVQRQVRRCLVAADGRPVSTSEMIRWAYPRQTKFESWQYAQARLAAELWADRTGTTRCRGAPILWIPNDGLMALIRGDGRE